MTRISSISIGRSRLFTRAESSGMRYTAPSMIITYGPITCQWWQSTQNDVLGAGASTISPRVSGAISRGESGVLATLCASGTLSRVPGAVDLLAMQLVTTPSTTTETIRIFSQLVMAGGGHGQRSRAADVVDPRLLQRIMHNKRSGHDPTLSRRRSRQLEFGGRSRLRPYHARRHLEDPVQGIHRARHRRGAAVRDQERSDRARCDAQGLRPEETPPMTAPNEPDRTVP